MANKSTKHRKFLATSLTAAMVASAVAPTAGFAAGFTDVKEDNFYYKYVTALSDAKIIDGRTDGSFDLGGKVTRAEASKMIANILKLDLEKAPAVPFTDVKQDAWYAKYVNALYGAKLIDGKSETTFDPNGTLTRAEFAKMVVEAYKIDTKKTAEVPFTDLEEGKWYVDFVKALYAEKLITGTTETTFSPNATVKRADFAKLLTEADWAKGSTLTKPETPSTKPEVTGVSATNLKEVKVEFNGTLSEGSASNVGSYSLKDEDGNTVPLKSARLQADGKTVVLTVGVANNVEQHLQNQEKYQLTVTNVKGTDTTKVYSVQNKEFTPVDAALPTLEKVEALGNKAIKLTFSEPVKNASTVAGTFKLDGAVVSGVLTGENTRTLIIELFTPMSYTEHTLSVNNKIEDFAGYKLVGLDQKFTVVEDKVAPTVTEVKNVTLESATVVFSEDVKVAEATNENNYYWLNGTTKHYADKVEQIDGKTYKLTFTGSDKLPAVATDLYIENIVDYSANTIAADTKVSINPVVDQTRPEVVSEIFNDANELKLTFNKAVDLSTFKTSNVVLKDSKGKVVTDYGVTVAEGYTGSSKTVTLVFSSNLAAGTYTVELSGLRDTTTLQNTMLPHTATIVAKDAAAPDVTAVAGTGNVYYVTFDKAMDVSTSASILNPENYYIAYTQNSSNKVGKLPVGTNIVPVNGNKGVIITLPTSVTAVSEITIQGVKSAGGVYLNGYAEKFGPVGNPIVSTFDASRAYATAKDTVYVKFNQPVARANKANFTVNGTPVANAVVDSNDSTLVKLTLGTKLSSTDTNGVNVVISGTGTENLAGLTVTGGTVSVGDAIAPEINKTASGKIGAADIVASNKKVTVKFSEALKSLNAANLKDNFNVYQANGLELEYGVDYSIDATNLTALGNGTAQDLVLDFTSSTYAGNIEIVFNNSNGNIVDATAVKTSTGAASNALSAKAFDTRDKSTSDTTITLVAPVGQYVVDVNLTNGEGNMAVLLKEIGDTTYNARTLAQQEEVALVLIKDRPALGFANYNAIVAALTAAESEYDALLVAVNSATTASAMELAIQNILDEAGFTAKGIVYDDTTLINGTDTERDLVAKELLAELPVSGYANIAEMIAVLKVAGL